MAAPQSIAKEAEARSLHIMQFDVDAADIAGGTHVGWMERIWHIYWPTTSNNKLSDPVERLKAEYGLERATIAISGLQNLLLRTGLIPSSEKILALWNDGKWYPWWKAILAGADLRWEVSRSLPSEKETLRTLVAIDALYPAYFQLENVLRRANKEWVGHLYTSNASLASDVLSEIVEKSLTKGERGGDALSALTSHDAFREIAPAMALELISRYRKISDDDLRQLLHCCLTDARHHAAINALAEISLGSDALSEDAAATWAAVMFLSKQDCLTYDQFDRLRPYAVDRDNWLEKIKALPSLFGEKGEKDALRLFSVGQLSYLAKALGQRDPYAESPNWDDHDQNAWERSRYVVSLLAELSSRHDADAYAMLSELAEFDPIRSYREAAKHYAANQKRASRQKSYLPPTWQQCQAIMSNGRPETHTDLLELTLEQLATVQDLISNSNIDPYKMFWNEDRYGRPTTPKPEESARDAILALLRPLLSPADVKAEPEDHRAQDKRADIAVSAGVGLKLPIEAKRDYHSEVWTACQTQLDRLYARDPDADGCGIYLVFWYGEKRPQTMPPPPTGIQPVFDAAGLQRALSGLIPHSKKSRQKVIVIDVSKPDV